jgi:hypothetical protein
VPKGFSGGPKGFSGGSKGFSGGPSGGGGYGSRGGYPRGHYGGTGGFLGGFFVGSALSRRSNGGAGAGGGNGGSNGGNSGGESKKPEPTAKKCNYCGTENDIAADKCGNCGAADFTTVEPTATAADTGGGEKTVAYQKAETAPAKAKRTKVIFIVALGLSLIVGVIIIATLASGGVKYDVEAQMNETVTTAFFKITVTDFDIYTAEDGNVYYYDDYYYALYDTVLYVVTAEIYNHTSYRQDFRDDWDFFLYDGKNEYYAITGVDYSLSPGVKNVRYIVFEVPKDTDGYIFTYTEIDADGNEGKTYGVYLD